MLLPSAGFSVAFGSTKSRGSAGGLVLFVLQVQGEGEGEGWFRGVCSPRKFLKFNSLKCNFLHSLDWNWMTRKAF